MARKKITASASGRASIGRPLQLIAAPLLLAALVYGAVAWQTASRIAANSHQALLESQTLTMVTGLQTRFALYATVLSQLARRPDVQSRAALLLGGKDRAARAAFEEELKSLVPDATEVRLLPAALDGLARPLGFADLALLRRAGKQVGPSPAGAQRDTVGDDFHITLAQRVIAADGKRISGYLAFFLPMSVVTGQLTQTVPKQGYAQVRQVGQSGKFLALTGVGTSAAMQGTPARITPIPGTLWQLAYWPDPRAGKLDTATAVLLLGTAAGLLALCLAMVFWQAHRLQQLTRRDMAALITLVREKTNGHGTPATATFAEHQDALVTLEKTLAQAHPPARKEVKPAAKEAVKRAEPGTGPAGDDSTGNGEVPDLDL